MADMENLVGMTAVQAGCVRSLGAWWGGRCDALILLVLSLWNSPHCSGTLADVSFRIDSFMAASKVLGEETANAGSAGSNTTAAKKE